jgi:UTP--glucose-1-phosphate uridylyltransferase
MEVRTAVIPAAGRGTRFLPLTFAVPKELLPVGAVPALHLVIDEAVSVGMNHIVLVISEDKDAVRRYLRPDAEVIDRVAESGRVAVAERLASLGSTVQVSFVVQDQPRGLGHAVGCARPVVGDEPFAVLLPDEIMGSSALLAAMAATAIRTQGSVVALRRVPRHEVSAYGVVSPVGEVSPHGEVAIGDVVEKPSVDQAPSDLIIIGRYVLTPDVFDHIDALTPGAGGELQLTDALRAQARRRPFHGVVSQVSRHDTGTPAGWVRAVVDRALDDPDTGADLATWLKNRLG